MERSAYEELQTSFDSFANEMRAMGNRSSEKGMSQWLDNQDVCQTLNISPRTLQTFRDNGTLAYSQIQHKIYYKAEDVENMLHIVEDRKREAIWRKRSKQNENVKQ